MKVVDDLHAREEVIEMIDEKIERKLKVGEGWK
jgi:hypothetical protein